MTIRKIKKLAQESYKGYILDKKKVNVISTMLSRSDLKNYINELKNIENKKNLIVSAPFSNIAEKLLIKIFPNKIIFYKRDDSLMLGVKIIDNDAIYEFSLKNTLENIISHIKQNYD